MARAAAVAILACLIVTGVLFGRPQHPHFAWERLPAWGFLAGLFGGLLLAGIAKGLLAPLLEREEPPEQAPHGQGEST